MLPLRLMCAGVFNVLQNQFVNIAWNVLLTFPLTPPPTPPRTLSVLVTENVSLDHKKQQQHQHHYERKSSNIPAEKLVERFSIVFT